MTSGQRTKSEGRRKERTQLVFRVTLSGFHQPLLSATYDGQSGLDELGGSKPVMV